MMRYFPVCIDTKDRKFLIVGGGRVATRKVKRLLDTEASLYVIAANFCEELAELAKDHPERIRLKGAHLGNDFRFLGYDALIIATDDRELNDALEARAKERHMLYLRADAISDSSFIMAKVLSKGDLHVAVSLGGKNPTITECVAEEIEKVLSHLSEEKIRVLNDIRAALVRKKATDIKETMESLYRDELIHLYDVLEEQDENHSRNEGQ